MKTSSLIITLVIVGIFVFSFCACFILYLRRKTVIPVQCPQGPSAFSHPVKFAYYTIYQDPYCSPISSCPQKGTPCSTTLLEDPQILQSKLDLVILNPISPNLDHGLTVAYPVQLMANDGKVVPPGVYPCPPALKSGIDALHKAGKRITLSLLPGTGRDQWGNSEGFWALFSQACQKVLTDWDVDGFDWDCETGECPPSAFGSSYGEWNSAAIAGSMRIFSELKSLKTNPGRGIPGKPGEPLVTWTAEMEWQLANLTNLRPFVSNLDYICTMNNDYSLTSVSDLQGVIKATEAKGFPAERLVLGFAQSDCGSGSQGRTSEFAAASQTLSSKVAGWIVWNISKDFGCPHGRTSGSCSDCKTGPCPIGQKGLSQDPRFSFLDILNKI